MTSGSPYLPHALALGVALALATPAMAARHALLIGVSDYGAAKLTELPGALTDLDLMQEVLRERLGFQAGEIKTLRDAEATHEEIRRAFVALAEAVRPGDFVYIHYSGHGSLIQDQNDEGERSGKDQTLVGFGARTPAAQGLDRYDILDDEVNAWLVPIAARAVELIYVADACHSATNTRGKEAPVARAAPGDDQLDHPLAKAQSRRDPLAGAVRIGAARDDQSAQEVKLEDGRSAGAFTSNWARALHQAAPGDTWRRVFDRAALWTAADGRTGQQPQISGQGAGRAVLGGAVAERPAVGVTKVTGRRVTLNAGGASGVTVGSLYALSEADEAPRVRVTEVSSTWSAGDLEQGTLAAGDFLIEREHAYTSGPRRVFALAPDEGADAALLERVRERVARLPGFALATSEGEADLLLALVRPTRVAGEAQYRIQGGRRDSLPIQDPSAAPEVWVLNRGEGLIHANLAVRLDPEAPGLEILARNLDRYRRVVELKRLSAVEAEGSGLGLALIRFDPCTPGSAGCLSPEGSEIGIRRVPGTAPVESLRNTEGLPEGTAVSFALTNPGPRDRYGYLFEIDPNGCVYPIFPTDEMNAAEALIPAGGSLDLMDDAIRAGAILDAEGDAALLLISTYSPINHRLLTQSCYERSRGAALQRGAAANPLEYLLLEAAQGSQTRSSFTLASQSWGAELVEYRVHPKDATPLP